MSSRLAHFSSGLLLAIPLMASLTNPVSADHEREPDFRWEAPQDFEGHLILRLMFEPNQQTWCRTTAFFATEPQASSPVYFWTHQADHWGSFSRRQAEQVHAEGLHIDTRQEWDGKAAAGIGSYESKDSPTIWTVAASNVKHWNNSITGNTPFAVEITCDEGGVIVRDLAGSRELVTFREDSMRGTGMTNNRATVQFQDYVERNFSSEEVVTFIRASARSGAQPGTITHTHPGGVDQYPLAILSQTIYKSDEPGNHRVEITRASAGLSPDFVLGLMGGLSPVDSFDELLY